MFAGILVAAGWVFEGLDLAGGASDTAHERYWLKRGKLKGKQRGTQEGKAAAGETKRRETVGCAAARTSDSFRQH